MSTVEMQIAERSRKYCDTALTNLHNFIDRAMLEECFDSLNRKGASGVDNQTWQEYNERRGERIPELLDRFKSGNYRAPHIRRVYIPKGDGKLRPLGRGDAERVLEVLPKRLGKYGLTLHPEKTKLDELAGGKTEEPGTFDFLGFTHYMGKSLKGNRILKRRTSRKKLRMTAKRIGEWIKLNRHRPVRELITQLNVKLAGHNAYYGITFNSRGIRSFYEIVKRILYKWLNRRGGNTTMNWAKYVRLINEWIPLVNPKIYQKFL